MPHIKYDPLSVDLLDSKNLFLKEDRDEARAINRERIAKAKLIATIADSKAHGTFGVSKGSFLSRSLKITGKLAKTTVKRARPGEIKKTTKKVVKVARPLVRELGKFTAVSAAAYFGAGALNAGAAGAAIGTSSTTLSTASSGVFAQTGAFANTGSLLGLGAPVGSGTVLAGTSATGTLLTGGALVTTGTVVGAGTVLAPGSTGVAQSGVTLSSAAASAKNTVGANSVLSKPAIGTGTVLKGTSAPAAGFVSKLIGAGEDATITGLLGLTGGALDNNTKPRALKSPVASIPQQKSAVPLIAMIGISILGIGLAITKGAA